MAEGYLGDPQDSLLTFKELRQFVIMLQGDLAAAQEKIATMQIALNQTQLNAGLLATDWQ